MTGGSRFIVRLCPGIQSSPTITRSFSPVSKYGSQLSSKYHLQQAKVWFCLCLFLYFSKVISCAYLSIYGIQSSPTITRSCTPVSKYGSQLSFSQSEQAKHFLCLCLVFVKCYLMCYLSIPVSAGTVPLYILVVFNLHPLLPRASPVSKYGFQLSFESEQALILGFYGQNLFRQIKSIGKCFVVYICKKYISYIASLRF